jgi:hypothetical protein
VRSRRHLSWRWILVACALVVVGVGLVRAWDDSRQVASGDGWQLLARQRAVGERGRVSVIDDQAAFDAAWTGLLLHADPPVVDFERSVVVWLTPLGTIACPTRLDRIRFDPDGHLVDGQFSLGLTFGCQSPSVSDTFLVAIDRDRLPATPYRIRILGPDPGDVVKGQLDLSD